MKTIIAKVIGHNSIEFDGEIHHAVPMNYVQVENFIGCTCYVNLYQSGRGYIIEELIKLEEE